MKQGNWRSRFGARDGEFSFELKVPVVHPNGEVECTDPPIRPKLCWWRMESVPGGWPWGSLQRAEVLGPEQSCAYAPG